jgi:UDP-N-acetylmuramate--alanine ligase
MVLTEAGFDPTIVVGGQVRILGTNARLGKGDFLVAEADEFDRSFLKLTPVVAVVTNVEEDHLDCYKDLEDILQSFAIFANRVPFYGAVVACADDPGVRRILPHLTRRVITYGVSEEASLRAREIKLEASGTTFEVWEGSWLLGTVRLSLPGRHNVANALAAIAVGRELSIPFPTIARAVAQFTGVVRRFETKGERDGVLVVDDYAHHPTEIEATLAAARQVFPNRRLVALFQPHLYSRTKDFWQRFGKALVGCDLAIVTDVYPSRERPIPGISGEMIAKAARDAGQANLLYVPDRKKVIDEVERSLRSGDVLLTLGAGDVVRVGEEYLKRAPRRV